MTAPDTNLPRIWTGSAYVDGPATPAWAPPGTSGGITQQQLDAAVANAVNGLLNGAPGALDTLKELADALGDDANYAATVANALALRAPLASPALTGSATLNGNPLIDKPTTQGVALVQALIFGS